MTQLISPAPYGWANLAFGATKPYPYNPSRPHAGRDWGYYYSHIESRIVVAAAGGVVERVYASGANNEGWGNRVVIRVNERVTIAVNHLLTGSVVVREGQSINAGDRIGTMGATGETYGQIHLHEEVYVDGKRVDPDYYRSHDLPGTEGPASGGSEKPFSIPTPEVPKGIDMSNIRIIDSPAYRAANQRVIHNGNAAMPVPAGWVQDLIQKGRVDFASYENDNDLVTEINLVWQLGGLDADAAAKKTAELIAKLK